MTELLIYTILFSWQYIGPHPSMCHTVAECNATDILKFTLQPSIQKLDTLINYQNWGNLAEFDGHRYWLLFCLRPWQRWHRSRSHTELPHFSNKLEDFSNKTKEHSTLCKDKISINSITVKQNKISTMPIDYYCYN